MLLQTTWHSVVRWPYDRQVNGLPSNGKWFIRQLSKHTYSNCAFSVCLLDLGVLGVLTRIWALVREPGFLQLDLSTSCFILWNRFTVTSPKCSSICSRFVCRSFPTLPVDLFPDYWFYTKTDFLEILRFTNVFWCSRIGWCWHVFQTRCRRPLTFRMSFLLFNEGVKHRKTNLEGLLLLLIIGPKWGFWRSATGILNTASCRNLTTSKLLCF